MKFCSWYLAFGVLVVVDDLHLVDLSFDFGT